jgi:hypothetical protein
MWCLGKPIWHFVAVQIPLRGVIAHSGCKAHTTPFVSVGAAVESGCLRVQPKVGGKPHLRLNMSTRPIANKYREGKLQRTLKREFKRA